MREEKRFIIKENVRSFRDIVYTSYQYILFYSNIVNKIITYEFIKQITSGKYQWYVCYHIYHACHVYQEARNIVIAHYNVRYNTVLDPLHGIARAVQYEEDKHQPSFLVNFNLQAL